MTDQPPPPPSGLPNKRRMRVQVAAEGVNPLCPHCEAELDAVFRQQIDEGLGKAYVWYCPACRKMLGISHRKGFWMG